MAAVGRWRSISGTEICPARSRRAVRLPARVRLTPAPPPATRWATIGPLARGFCVAFPPLSKRETTVKVSLFGITGPPYYLSARDRLRVQNKGLVRAPGANYFLRKIRRHDWLSIFPYPISPQAVKAAALNPDYF